MKRILETLTLVSLMLEIACGEAPFYRVDPARNTTEKETPYDGNQTPVVKTEKPKDGDLIPEKMPAPLKDSELLSQINDDISKLNPTEAPKTRYFSLQMANNVASSPQVLETQRMAFKKVLNSLSDKPAIATPTAIDKDRLIYRVNLDDIGMTPAEFDKVISDHYPFNNRFADTGTSESIANEQRDGSNRRLLRADIPVIRMDWFNATAMLPIPYKKFMKFPDTLAEFEDDFLGGDRLANILADDVIRVGFDNSQQALSNRVLERHDGPNGGFYVSYEFSQQKQGQIFRAPLGPIGANARNRALEFQEDQRSVITTLPNGLFAYFLASAQGTALDKAPINLIRNFAGPDEFSVALLNGQSCASCHHAGLIVKDDTLLSALATNRQLFNAADLSRINRMYQPEVFKEKVAQDNEKYFEAMKKLGLSATNPDPVDVAYRFYNRPMTKIDVMKESGLTERDVNLALLDPEFSGSLNALNNPDGTIARASFQAVYPNLIRKFKQEYQRVAPKAADFLVTADCMADDAVRMDTCIVRP